MEEKQKIAARQWKLEHSYSLLPELFFSRLAPTPVRAPALVIFNSRLAAQLGLDGHALQQEGGVQVLAGNRVPAGAVPLAQAYAGHQFGHFTMLGDGRAVVLGEQVTPNGERFDIQLKGSGRTPYSRRGDGRAALGPMLREYIISEAMQGLGIATTRSLAVVSTGEAVIRETEQIGAVLTRVAASHLRVGTFQYAAYRGSLTDLTALADYAIERHYPELSGTEDCYMRLLQAVLERQAQLIAQWQLVGFVHGVMNTDNMTISGETIDYGPCAFIDTYDPAAVFSSIDQEGRYAYGNQPYIAGWNLARLAEALLPLLDADVQRAAERAEVAVNSFTARCQAYWLAGMRQKLGLYNAEEDDGRLIQELLLVMQAAAADYTNTFRALTLGAKPEKLGEERAFGDWQAKWSARLARQPHDAAAVRELMQTANPAIIARNHQVEAVLDSAVRHGDYQPLERLVAVLAEPYAYTPAQDVYAELPPASTQPYRTFCGT